jgi:hypothetical protein
VDELIVGLLSNFQPDTFTIVRYMLMPAAERNGEVEIQPMDTYAPLMRHWHSANWLITGSMRVSYTIILTSIDNSQTLDQKTGKKLKELICAHCRFTPNQENAWRNLVSITQGLPPLQASVPPLLPFNPFIFT